MAKELSTRVTELVAMPPEELRRAFSSCLEDIRLYGPGRAMEQFPAMLSGIIRKLVEIDAARFANDVPEAMDMFMNLLWECIGAAIDKREHLTSVLKSTRELTVNLEVADSPLRSHLRITKEGISGGSGLLHFKDQDLRYLGSTTDLLRALAGVV